MTIARILAAKGRDVVTTQPHRTLAEVAEVRRSISIRKGRHFDGEIIIVYVRWYLRFKVSFRDLVEMMAERGICLAHTTIIDLRKNCDLCDPKTQFGCGACPGWSISYDFQDHSRRHLSGVVRLVCFLRSRCGTGCESRSLAQTDPLLNIIGQHRPECFGRDLC
jgi:hypothetical protein